MFCSWQCNRARADLVQGGEARTEADFGALKVGFAHWAYAMSPFWSDAPEMPQIARARLRKNGGKRQARNHYG